MKSILKDPDLRKSLGEQADQLAKTSSYATTLRVDGSVLELAALGARGEAADTNAGALATLPADTVAAVSAAGIGPKIGAQFDTLLEQFPSGFAAGFASSSPSQVQLGGAGGIDQLDPSQLETPSPPDPRDLLDEIERSTDLTLPADLETLFGDNLLLAIGGHNLETLPTLTEPANISALDIALSMTSDRTKALDLAQRLAKLATDADIPLIAAGTDDGAVLATNQEAADAIIAKNGTLGKQKAFTDVIPDATHSKGGVYINVRAILDKVSKADPPEDVARDIEQAKALSAVGFSVARSDGDRSLIRLRISFAR